ncbi:MAG: hypothetical protein AB2784_16845 [Candidatus Thiodiazotropha endolucinida]
MRDEIAMVEQCAGCEHLDNEKQVGGTGHCYMFREPIPNCSQYTESPSDPGGYVEFSADEKALLTEGVEKLIWSMHQSGKGTVNERGTKLRALLIKLDSA